MSHPIHHAMSSARKWGGKWEEYLPIHEWFDASKEMHGDFRHRAMRHHSQGIFECEREFGTHLQISTGRLVPVRFIAEQHVIEDCGRIPSLSDWLSRISPEPWMNRKISLGVESDNQRRSVTEDELKAIMQMEEGG